MYSFLLTSLELDFNLLQDACQAWEPKPSCFLFSLGGMPSGWDSLRWCFSSVHGKYMVFSVLTFDIDFWASFFIIFKNPCSKAGCHCIFWTLLSPRMLNWIIPWLLFLGDPPWVTSRSLSLSLRTGSSATSFPVHCIISCCSHLLLTKSRNCIPDPCPTVSTWGDEVSPFIFNQAFRTSNKSLLWLSFLFVGRNQATSDERSFQKHQPSEKVIVAAWGRATGAAWREESPAAAALKCAPSFVPGLKFWGVGEKTFEFALLMYSRPVSCLTLCLQTKGILPCSP